MADSEIVQRLLNLSREGKLNDSVVDSVSSRAAEVSLAMQTTDDVELGKLNWSPRENWVEKFGDLPKYIEEVAIGIMKSGKTREQAIPIAISRIKRWAAGLDGVKADTVAKATVALAQWEALKAKAKAARLKKK